MIRKIYHWLFTTLQVLLLIAACGIQYFSMKNMGMMRYVIYVNREWEIQYPIAELQYAAIGALLLLSLSIILYVKTKRKNYFIDKKFLLMFLAEVVLTLAFVFFSLAYSTEIYRSYYFISIILAISALIQDIKILAYLKRPDYSR